MALFCSTVILGSVLHENIQQTPQRIRVALTVTLSRVYLVYCYNNFQKPFVRTQRGERIDFILYFHQQRPCACVLGTKHERASAGSLRGNEIATRLNIWMYSGYFETACMVAGLRYFLEL